MTNFHTRHVGKHPDGQQTRTCYYKHDRLHHGDGPAVIDTHPNGVVAQLKYYQEGVCQRDPVAGPAVQRFNDDGSPWRHEYRVCDQLHNPHGAAVVMLSPGGKPWYVEHWLHGQRHRPDGKPAVETYHPDGRVRRTEFYENGLLHRDGGPAIEEFDHDGNRIWAEYFVRGNALEDLPAPDPGEVEVRETRYPGGALAAIEHLRDGCRHRAAADGPAYERFFPDGTVMLRSFYENGELQRDPGEGPALEEFYINGQPREQHYLSNGQYHRDPADGPAFALYRENGECTCSVYYDQGRHVPRPDLGAAHAAQSHFQGPPARAAAAGMGM